MGWLDAIATFLAGLFASSENKKVKAVRDATVRYCGFLPTVETVLALFAANPAVTIAAVIARKICAAVSPHAVMGLISAPIMVDGVEIKGEFVGKD